MDELPQLFNVLKGDMSLVGPRPHALAHDDEYKALIAKYAFRHHVKPGMTGWAQVNGLRGETGRSSRWCERVDLDLWYVNHWSLGLDLNILLRTCFEVLRNRAYSETCSNTPPPDNATAIPIKSLRSRDSTKHV